MPPDPPNPPPACARCRHYFVTYEASLPHGCRLFGIRSRQLPSLAVRQETSSDCAAFEPRPDPKRP